MNERAARPPIAARIAAGLVFLFGVALMAGTFYLAFTMFHNPQEGLFPPSAKGAAPAGLATIALVIVARVGLLFIMAYAGSSIASKGIALYEATRARAQA